MFRHSPIFKVLAFIVLIGVMLIIYVLLIRPWQLRWGATDEEVMRPMPGDELVLDPTFNATRAVTVKARPEQIWPWLVQIGYGRAGWYSYDLIDNFGKRSSERIIPGLQHIEVGDEVPISPWISLKVSSFEINRFMVWVSQPDPPDDPWTWGLYPIDEDHTRLITRLRSRYKWKFPDIVINLGVDVFDISFMRMCMLGIKQRAEGRITDTYEFKVAEVLLWFIAFIEFIIALILVIVRKNWWGLWIVALAAGFVLMLLFYAHPALWKGGFLDIGILIALVWTNRRSVGLKKRSRY